MRLPVLLSALIVAGTVPALAAETPAHKQQRELQNADVLMSQYPPRALAAGEQGLVGFKVALDKDGHPTSCQVTHSSGYARLDAETCDLLVSRAVFKPVHNASGDAIRSEHEGVMNWRLPNSRATVKAPVAVASANAPAKTICKRSVRTGSLVARERTCMSKKEWQRATDDSRANWEELQGKGYTQGN